ncbi:MAG: FKBP-type peptidyl-prolyl cis-trans isomerase [Clostridia bacterium]|nr:FKBP-type peptidyl-prolyl cis-trans isomerase [Clostridia bacterium]
MKRIITLALALMMVASLCACNTTSTGTSTPDATGTAGATATATPTPVAFSIDKSSYVMFVNEKLMLTPTVSAGTTWESSDKEVASINENGVVVGLKKGSTTITAKSAKGESAVCEIKVIDAADFFTPADITKLTLKKSEIDKSVKEELDYMCDYFKTLVKVDREVKDGDSVRATFVGTLKGENAPFDGGTGTTDIEIGSKTFIDGFESGLIGAKKGDNVTLELRFPDDYVNPETDADAAAKLNGKEVTFVVTIHEVMEYKPAELTDDLIVRATNSTYKTVAEYKKYVEDSFKEYLKIELAITSSEVKGFDEDMLKIYKDIYIQNTYGGYASMYGMSVEDFVKTYYGLSAEDLQAEADKSAKGYIEQLYLCYALNLKPTEEERNTIITNYMKSIGYTLSVEEFIKAYGESFVDNYVVTEFALSYVDKTITIDENN